MDSSGNENCTIMYNLQISSYINLILNGSEFDKLSILQLVLMSEKNFPLVASIKISRNTKFFYVCTCLFACTLVPDDITGW